MAGALFISISSYCDPELIPTIRDCVAKARYPEELHIAVCWQHEPGAADDPNDLDVSPASLMVIDVPYMEAKGCCWARAQTQALYNGENWFLQLDSHHRFIQDWDAVLYQQVNATRSSKPILSTYPSEYQAGPPETFMDLIPQVMMVNSITPGSVMFRGGLCDSWVNEPNKTPSRARFMAAGFIFAPGSFVKDVPYDPSIYFYGEEITLAARAFSHGYDIFHPSKQVLWHQYTRQGCPKHWDHHPDWGVASGIGDRRVRDLLTEWPIGKYEFGNVRSKAEYEAYTGLNFTTWSASDAAIRGEEPADIIPFVET